MITQSGGVDEETPKPKNLNSFAKLLEGVEPLDGYPFRGLGKRKYIQIKLKKHNMAFEFFAESFISPAPQDSGIGFDENDVTQRYGVIQYHILNETDNIEERSFSGDYIDFDEFLEKYITNAGAMYALECYMDTLVDGAQLGEEFFSKMNKLWADRELNTPQIYDTITC